MKRSWNLPAYAFARAQDALEFSASFPCPLAHNGNELNIWGINKKETWIMDLCVCFYGCLRVFHLLSDRFQRFYFILMPSHPQWQRGFVLLFTCWIETSPWFLVKGTRADMSSRVCQSSAIPCNEADCPVWPWQGQGQEKFYFYAVTFHSQWTFLSWPTFFRPVYIGVTDKLMFKGLSTYWFYESSVSPSVCHSWLEEQDAELSP